MGAVKKVNSFLTMESENYEGTMGIVLSIILFHLNIYFIYIIVVCQIHVIFAFVFHFNIQRIPSHLDFVL